MSLTILESVSWLPCAFSRVRRRRRASSCQSDSTLWSKFECPKPGGSFATPNNAKSWFENDEKYKLRSWGKRSTLSTLLKGGLWRTMPPHWGNKKAFDAERPPNWPLKQIQHIISTYSPLSLRISRGRRLAEGIKRIKWRTGSLDELEAAELSALHRIHLGNKLT